MESATKTVGRKGPAVLGGIWNTWSDALGREPRIQFDEFFAVPVHVKEAHATTIRGLLRVHKQIWAQMRKTLEENDKVDALIRQRLPWTDPKYFKLKSIYEALFVVSDEYKPLTPVKHADGNYHYDDLA
jgi:hypothetical protein